MGAAVRPRARDLPDDLKPEDFDPTQTTYEEVVEAFLNDALDGLREREEEIGSEQLREIERLVLLSVIDNRWREHLYEMDYLQEGIGLRAVGQKDPLVEYQREGYDMFIQMQGTIKEDFARYIFHVEAVREDEQQQPTASPPGTTADPDGPDAGCPARREADGQAQRPAEAESVVGRASPFATRSLATPPAPAVPARSTSSATGDLARQSSSRSSCVAAPCPFGDRGQV